MQWIIRDYRLSWYLGHGDKQPKKVGDPIWRKVYYFFVGCRLRQSPARRCLSQSIIVTFLPWSNTVIFLPQSILVTFLPHRIMVKFLGDNNDSALAHLLGNGNGSDCRIQEQVSSSFFQTKIWQIKKRKRQNTSRSQSELSNGQVFADTPPPMIGQIPK